MVEIRAARVGDAAALAGVHVATWRAAYAGLLPDELLRSLSVAEREASVGPARDDDLSEDVSELWSLYVHPDSWGAGVGHALHSRALLRMRERAASSGTLWVLTANDRARRFYEAHGWLADGTEQTAWRADVPLEESRFRLPDLT